MLIRRVNYLEYDDELIRRFAGEGLKDMHIDEVKAALEERGVYIPRRDFEVMARSMYDLTSPLKDKTGLKPKSQEECINMLKYWLKLNDHKHPDRDFRHEVYLKEMIRWSRLPDL